MRSFLDEQGVATLPHVPDDDGELWRSFGVRSQPSWLIIPADGSEPQLVFGALGESNFADFAS